MNYAETPSQSSLSTEGASAVVESHSQSVTSATRVSLHSSFKLPAFSRKNTASWFLRAEVHFRGNNMTDESAMADQIMMALPEDVFDEISPWLEAKGGSATYDELKEKLTQTFALPIPTRAKMVMDLASTPLGDVLPSKAWDEISSLVLLKETDAMGNRKEISLSREIFLRRLPQSIRAQLANAEALSMKELVKQTDHLFIAARASKYAATPAINAVVEKEPADDDEDVKEEPIYAVQGKRPFKRREWTPRQQADPRQQQQQQHHHSLPPGGPRRPPPTRSSDEHMGYCWAHRIYGSKAYRCRGNSCTYQKLDGGPRTIAAVADRGSQSACYYVSDELSGQRILVDTGAVRSIFPPTDADRSKPSTDAVSLIAANGSPIRCYGLRRRKISIKKRTFHWSFLIADVGTPLLGADFLAHHGLLVDVAGKRLLDLRTFRSLPITPGPDNRTIYAVGRTAYDNLLHEFPDVFKPELRQVAGTPAKHGIFHHISTTGPPTHTKFRRLPPNKLRDAKNAFAEMERMGICRKASSPWASPLHMVKKSDGTWRPCGDYRKLNLVTTPDHYPLPNMQDITGSLHGAKIFSKMDLLKSYFQVPVHEDDIPKTAIITPFGSYTFAYSTFGLRNAGATFQRLMDCILGDLPFCACYVDDILVFSKSEEEHLHHVRTVLKRLQENGLVVRFDKCTFGARNVDFLGHEISAEGVRPMSSKVDAIKRFPAPTSVKGLQEFLGMVNYYRRFLPDVAGVMAPLSTVLKGKPKELKWGPEQQRAFEKTKEALRKATCLSYQKPGASLRLTTDASNVAYGAVLEQVVNGVPQPLAFFSRKLQKPETKYSTFDRELLAVYQAVRHFKFLLEGETFEIRTDHRPLIHAFTKPGDAWSGRQQRQLAAISEFGCTLTYVPGKNNPVADALSRIEINALQLGVDYEDLAKEQAADQETAEFRTATSSLKWEDMAVGPSGTSLLCDVSTGRPRPFVPASRRRQIFDVIHGLSHPGASTSIKLMTAKFVWHGIRKDVREWARTCISCQTSKVSRHTESGIGRFPQPKRRFGHIHVDVVGPLPQSGNAKYLLTIIDRSTRWPEATPMHDASTTACAEALLSSWVSRFGVPDDITTDRGPAFLSELWASLARLMGTKLHSTTAYNPAANGMVERSHRSLKAALMARCTDENWLQQLPWVLLGLRTAPKSNGEASPAEKVYGETLAVPGEFFPSTADEDVPLDRLRAAADKFVPYVPTYADKVKRHIPTALSSSAHVFVRNDAHRVPLTRPYRGPYRVIERTDKAYKLMVHGREDWVSIDRLKPAYLQDQDTIQEAEGRRPRLPPQQRPTTNDKPGRRRGRPRKNTAVEPPGPRRGGILPEDSNNDGILSPPRRPTRRCRLTNPANYRED